MAKVIVEIYSKDECGLCQEAKEIINKANAEIPFIFKEINITSSEDLYRRYKEDIPTIFINGRKAFKYKVDEREFRRKIRKEVIKARMSTLFSRSYRLEK